MLVNDNDPLVTSVSPATRALLDASASDAASYFNRHHRNFHNIQVLYRAMRAWVNLPRDERVLFLNRLAELV